MSTLHDAFCISLFAGALLFSAIAMTTICRDHKRIRRMAEACRRKETI